MLRWSHEIHILGISIKQLSGGGNLPLNQGQCFFDPNLLTLMMYSFHGLLTISPCRQTLQLHQMFASFSLPEAFPAATWHFLWINPHTGSDTVEAAQCMEITCQSAQQHKQPHHGVILWWISSWSLKHIPDGLVSLFCQIHAKIWMRTTLKEQNTFSFQNARKQMFS